MTIRQWILKIAAVGSGVSVVMLVMMSFIVFPAGLEYPGVSVLTGRLILSLDDLNIYLEAIRYLFMLDSLFLLGWIIAWIGIAEVVRVRFRTLGILTLIFGLTGAFFDFGENSIVWGVLQNLLDGRSMNSDWVARWKAVQHLSYWLPFIGAFLAALGLWSTRIFDKILAVVGTLLVVLAAIGLYLPGLSLLPNLWFLCWFLCSSWVLWKHSGEKPLYCC